MQTSTMSFVVDFRFGKNELPKICGAFTDISSAINHSQELKKQYGDELKLEIFPAYSMIGNKKSPECESFDFRKHIAFDITKMEIPLKYDLCNQNATHFCNLHGGIYCNDHITNHEDMVLKKEPEK